MHCDRGGQPKRQLLLGQGHGHTYEGDRDTGRTGIREACLSDPRTSSSGGLPRCTPYGACVDRGYPTVGGLADPSEPTRRTCISNNCPEGPGRTAAIPDRRGGHLHDPNGMVKRIVTHAGLGPADGILGPWDPDAGCPPATLMQPLHSYNAWHWAFPRARQPEGPPEPLSLPVSLSLWGVGIGMEETQAVWGVQRVVCRPGLS